jgi:hypothetical protein
MITSSYYMLHLIYHTALSNYGIDIFDGKVTRKFPSIFHCDEVSFCTVYVILVHRESIAIIEFLCENLCRPFLAVIMSYQHPVFFQYGISLWFNSFFHVLHCLLTTDTLICSSNYKGRKSWIIHRASTF